MRPTYYYGRRHNYAFFPIDWVDTETGTSYQKGYYDENGQRYDNVAFEEDGKYKNVVCHCPYCDQDTILDLSASDVISHSLRCGNCGGPMEIVSKLDTILDDSANTIPNTHTYNSEESLKNAFPAKKKKRGWLIIAAAILALAIGRSIKDTYDDIAGSIHPSGNQIQQISIIENNGSSSNLPSTIAFGDNVFLEKQSDGSYRRVNDVIRADKVLYFDKDADSYYDEASDCWLWYNTDVEPAIWQYWYEGISSDFGDYGWMEHDGTGWYIEISEGNWIPLPAKYDSSNLWYVQK